MQIAFDQNALWFRTKLTNDAHKKVVYHSHARGETLIYLIKLKL